MRSTKTTKEKLIERINTLKELPSEDFVVFFYKDYKFILTNIPKKYW